MLEFFFSPQNNTFIMHLLQIYETLSLQNANNVKKKCLEYCKYFFLSFVGLCIIFTL